MAKYKILYTLNHARVAGTERHVIYLLKNLNKNLFEPYIACFSQGPLINQLNEMGFKAVSFPRAHYFGLRSGFNLFKFMQKNRFDIVHSHCGQFSCIIGKMAKTPVLVETRHGLCKDFDQVNKISPFEILLNRGKANLVDLSFTVAESDTQLMVEKYHIAKNKLKYVTNGISLADVPIPSESIKTEITKSLGLKRDHKIVGTVARLSEQKGIEYFIGAMAQIKTELPQTQFVIVGDGELGEHLHAIAKKSAATSDIIFTGYRSDATSIMSVFDIFVLPSIWEGMPYSILEAMALKKPVVTTRVFGNTELVIDDHTGYSVQPKNSISIAEAVIKLLKNPEASSNMGQNGYERIKKHFSAKEMTAKIENTYLALLKGIDRSEFKQNISSSDL